MCMFYSFHVEVFLLLHADFRAPEGKSAGFMDTWVDVLHIPYRGIAIHCDCSLLYYNEVTKHLFPSSIVEL